MTVAEDEDFDDDWLVPLISSTPSALVELWFDLLFLCISEIVPNPASPLAISSPCSVLYASHSCSVLGRKTLFIRFRVSSSS